MTLRRFVFVSAISCCFISCFPGFALASLIYTSTPGVIYDNAHNSYWFADLSVFTTQTYAEQTSSISTINDDPNFQSVDWGMWHMADLDEMTNLWSYSAEEIVGVFNPAGLQPTNNHGEYIARFHGRYDYFLPYPINGHRLAIVNAVTDEELSFFTDHWMNTLTDGYSVHKTALGLYVGAWVTADANPVPIPPVLWLFGSGLLGLVGMARRKKA